MSLRRKPPVGNVRRVAAIGLNLRGVITNKTGRIVQFESFAERSLLLRLDRDRSVSDYASQPETFRATQAAGTVCRYTPDFIVWRDDGTVEIHEVTRSSRRTSPHAQRREQLATTICQARGWRYTVHTEETLPQGSELANLLGLFRYRAMAYGHAEMTTAVRDYLHRVGTAGLDTVCCRLVQQTQLSTAQVLGTLYHLLWHQTLNTDLGQPLWDGSSSIPGVSVWLSTAER